MSEGWFDGDGDAFALPAPYIVSHGARPTRPHAEGFVHDLAYSLTAHGAPPSRRRARPGGNADATAVPDVDPHRCALGTGTAPTPAVPRLERGGLGTAAASTPAHTQSRQPDAPFAEGVRTVMAATTSGHAVLCQHHSSSNVVRVSLSRPTVFATVIPKILDGAFADRLKVALVGCAVDVAMVSTCVVDAASVDGERCRVATAHLAQLIRSLGGTVTEGAAALHGGRNPMAVHLVVSTAAAAGGGGATVQGTTALISGGTTGTLCSGDAVVAEDYTAGVAAAVGDMDGAAAVVTAAISVQLLSARLRQPLQVAVGTHALKG
jgi:hypothetical protein